MSFAPVAWVEAIAALPASRDATEVSSASAADRAAALARLNAATAADFPDIAASPVPVLLPLDAGVYLGDQSGATTPARLRAAAAGFQPSNFFLSGPAGYDATFTLRPTNVPELADIRSPFPVEVEISGSLLLYELADTPASSSSAGKPMKGLDEEIPGLRRLIHDGTVRYTFVRFGVPYAVSMYCIDGPPRLRRISCRQADRIAARFLRALQILGGTQQSTPATLASETIARPQTTSPEFTYHGPGRLLPGSGYRRNGGSADYTVYARFRFPIAHAPAYANSQSFMHWGDCYRKGRRPAPSRKGQPYRCLLNDKPLVFDESSTENYSYPWRDNFCETRDRRVGQCPGGYGHQGQDIRPASCTLRNAQADRCQPYRHDVVAVRDGAILRAPRHEAVHLVVNGASERFRVRYMHMNPQRMNQDGLVSGRRVREGEVIGQVGNYDRRPGGTTYHLHFDLQVPTKDGWVWVNPYMSLVAAYERLIDGRGREIKDGDPEPEVAAPNDQPGTAGERAADAAINAAKNAGKDGPTPPAIGETPAIAP